MNNQNKKINKISKKLKQEDNKMKKKLRRY